MFHSCSCELSVHAKGAPKPHCSGAFGPLLQHRPEAGFGSGPVRVRDARGAGPARVSVAWIPPRSSSGGLRASCRVAAVARTGGRSSFSEEPEEERAPNSGPGTPAPEPRGRRVSPAPQADQPALSRSAAHLDSSQLGPGLRRAMPLPDTMFCAQQIHIPPELPDILKQFTKAAIRTQPADVLQWSAGYFSALSRGDPLPVKDRIEMPMATQKTDTGLTQGLLKVLHKQCSHKEYVELADLEQKWKNLCLPVEKFRALLQLDPCENKIEGIKFLALGCSMLGGSSQRPLEESPVLRIAGWRAVGRGSAPQVEVVGQDPDSDHGLRRCRYR
ncbi:hypothetical protein J1605_022235 [Eschrichtius robustus]|uniref:Ropporin-1-like protein n=1 Tax=Eschrichtius robustus TaxID=9764 RepID=A0AB34HC99_ESCRO|nr:hypothetical protein J1605_022235 [Eschrichtius robustus]